MQLMPERVAIPRPPIARDRWRPSATVGVALWLALGGVVGAQVRINEVVASNLDGITDEDGDTPDWIELRNQGATAVDLSGYGLSDDPGEPLKWTLPAGAVLPAGAHVVVYASGKDRQGPPHTNFKLSASGETVVLAEPSGAIIDQLDTGQLWVDVSRGLGAADELLYFDRPTPNAPNTALGRPAFTPSVTLEPAGGLYDDAVAVTILDAPPGASLFYTLDGSDPTAESNPWPGALVLAEPTNVLRVRAFREDEWPSQIASASYFIGLEPNLPVLSMIIDPDDLYGPDGIYNFFNLFDDLEQPMHAEYFEIDGSGGFASPGGAKIHGGGSRFQDMKSFRFVLRGGYGASELSYPIFDDYPITEFERLIFRAHGQDWRRANLRDPYIQALATGEDLDVQAYQPTMSFVNGEYWGVYNIRERHDESYAESRAGTDQIDLLERNATPREGDAEHYNAMLDFIRENDLSIEENYEYVQTQMDTAEHQTYFALEIFAGNGDWPVNNIKFWRPRTPDGRWRWMVYDTEFGFGLIGDYRQQSMSRLLTPGEVQEWATELFRGLLQSPTYKNSFLNRFADYLNTRFSTAETDRLLREMATRIGPEMPFHQARWDSTFDAWLDQIQEMGEWTVKRPGYVRDDIVETFGLPGTFDLTLDVAPPGTGSIRLTAITVDSSFTGEYFLGVPVSLTAEPAPGWEFAAWTDPDLPQETAIELLATGDTELGAIFQPAGPTGDAVIHEINYNSEVAFDPGDWIEIHNPGGAEIDLTGWQLSDENPSNVFTFPAGTVIPAGGYLVAAVDVAGFEALFPGVSAVGDIGFGFGAGGDDVRLLTPEGVEYDVVEYDDESPWPTEPDGQGPTLELIDPALDNNQASSWTASNAAHGTPGAPNG